MAQYSALPFLSNIHPVLLLMLLLPTLFVIQLLYYLSPLHPLYHIPGPLLPRLTSLWLVYHAWVGDECTTIHALHDKFGPLVRTGPNSVHISSGSALHDIYSGNSTTKTSTTGFLKPEFYRNFDIDGHISIFSALDPAYRAVRAKAVTAIFSMTALRNGQEAIDACVGRYIERLRREKEKALTRRGVDHGKVDVLNVSRGLAIDTVTSYLFGEVYGGCEEDLQSDQQLGLNENDKQPSRPGSNPKLTASAMVNAFVAVGRFWYLPLWAFSLLDRLLNALRPDHEANASISRIDDFVASAVAKAEQPASGTADTKPRPDDGKDTYQTRLLSTARISPSETRAQCKDLIFAGTDSTAMNLATILFHLSSSPSVLSRLRSEIDRSPPDADPQALPYLRGVVREGLRLAMANPSRLPRVVPPTGWTFGDCTIAAGTVVGCSAYELHFNPDTFPEPRLFRPERWTETKDERRLEVMNREFIPFGLGPRQCIARNLATVELFYAVKAVVESGILDGSEPVGDKIEILEWFNSKVVGERIELKWTK